ncbi:hypothetical protein EDD16DRAFT_1722218 [Pisolithus croceorrhizus]|nr:hypothetical protein EDD16DRAFT_1722218 [Pisolithus croceorrhizus]
MPLNGPEALGWALATLMLSFILGVCQAVYVVNAVGGPFNLALVLSTVMWGTFLGIPTWHGIYSSYQEYRILLGRYHQLRIRVGVLVEARNLEPPRISPPSYEAHEFRDLDYQPDLDPVPRYPLSPPPYLLDLPINQREINVHEHYVDWPQRLIGPSAYHENPVAPDLLGGRPNDLLELLPSTPDGDDEDPNRSLSDAHPGIQMSAVVINRNTLITKPVIPSRPFPIAVERETAIALEKIFHHSHMKIRPSIPFPAFTLTNDIFFYFKGRVHPFYNFQDFAGFIPSLWVWNHHLERTFRGSWNSDKTTLECTPRYLRSRTKNGEQRRDPKVVLSLQDLKSSIYLERKVWYDEESQQLNWRSYGRITHWVLWPSKSTVLLDLQREMDKGDGKDLFSRPSRGLYSRRRQRAHANRAAKSLSASRKLS